MTAQKQSHSSEHNDNESETTMTSTKTTANIAEGVELASILTQYTGIEWTFGYIGNVDGDYDDRAWFAFAEHPGRAGTRNDRIGGQSTEDLGDLILVLRSAVQLARVLAHRATSRTEHAGQITVHHL